LNGSALAALSATIVCDALQVIEGSKLILVQIKILAGRISRLGPI